MESNNNLPDPANTTYLIDASIYIFRAWFGIPDHFFDDSGRSVNAVYGFHRFLRRFLDIAKPQNVVAAFDQSLESGFRHQIYEPYKANRALPDDALAHQLTCCQAITEQLGIATVASSVYEADDLIAALAKKRRQKGEQIVVLSTDKDLAQAIQADDYLWDFNKQKLWDYPSLEQEWGFPLSRVPDYLAIVGDSIDNIPGISGVGAKTGKVLMEHFQSIDDLYDRIEDIPKLPLRGATKIAARLQGSEEEVRLYRQLTLLHEGAKCSASDKAVKLKKINQKTLQSWLDEMGLQNLIK